MKLKVNNQHMDIKDNATVACVLKRFGASGQFALAVNGRFVSKHNYLATMLVSGDEIEILSPIQGG